MHLTQEKKRRHTSTRSNELGSVFVANTVIDETAFLNVYCRLTRIRAYHQQKTILAFSMASLPMYSSSLEAGRLALLIITLFLRIYILFCEYNSDFKKQLHYVITYNYSYIFSYIHAYITSYLHANVSVRTVSYEVQNYLSLKTLQAHHQENLKFSAAPKKLHLPPLNLLFWKEL